MRERRIVRDGAGYGVQERDGYDEYWFLNDEPFPSARSARDWLHKYDQGLPTNWDALRRNWAHGVYDEVEESE